MTLWPCCHTSVTLDDTVTVIVTSHEIIKKDIEGSRRIVKFTNDGLSFSFISIYFLTFLFLEHRIRVSDGHESQDAWNKVEGSRTNDIIQHRYHMLTVVATTRLNCPMISLMSKAQNGLWCGNSQENSTRSLCLISVLFIQMCPGPCYHYLSLPYSPCFILMSASLLTQGHHVYSRCPDVIFQTLLLCSRPMTSHYVTCHVTSLSHAFFIVSPGK